MKLNSGELKKIVAQRAVELVHTRFDDDMLEEAQKEAGNVKRWKRHSKRKIKSGWHDGDCADADDVIEDLYEGADVVDVFDPEPVTGDCIMRYFVNDWLEDALDPTVVTDPTDTKILLISWHSD